MEKETETYNDEIIWPKSSSEVMGSKPNNLMSNPHISPSPLYWDLGEIIAPLVKTFCLLFSEVLSQRKEKSTLHSAFKCQF